MAIARPSIRVMTAPATDAEFAVGASKFGGRPDLPYSAGWPSVIRNGQRTSLPFIAQINLADVAGLAAAQPLPPLGWLWFFAETGLFPHYGKQGRVLYFAGHADDLVRRDHPRGHRAYPACALDFIAEVNLRYVGAALPPLPADKSLSDFYALQHATHYPSDNGSGRSGIHRLMGSPYGLPADIGAFCHLLNATPNPYLASSPQWLEARTHETDWRMLLEIGEDLGAGLDWMEGAIGFAIRHTDLAQRHFGNICFQHKTPDFRG